MVSDTFSSPSDTPSPRPGAARSIVLVGMMGAGKSSVGKKLAARLALPFIDADHEIEAAAGMSISQLMESYGEPEFRRLERRVMVRLLEGPMRVISTGGGAFMDPETRNLIRQRGISVWLKADPAILLERALRHDNRPLLRGGDPKQIMADLLKQREPIYAEADITAESDHRPVDETVTRVVKALENFTASMSSDKLDSGLT
jgi:shikimate kinase